MNNDLIDTINKAIKHANDYIEYVEKKSSECYKDCGHLYDYIIPKPYVEEEKVRELEYAREVLLKLNEENIDLKEKYYITDNVYLNIFLWKNQITFNFYLKDDSWLYENYIESHSGITEWINDIIDKLYALYSGNSEYCYAFGTLNMKSFKKIIENEDKNYTVKEVVGSIKFLIQFFTDDKNNIRNSIIDDIEQLFKKLHYLREKGEYDE